MKLHQKQCSYLWFISLSLSLCLSLRLFSTIGSSLSCHSPLPLCVHSPYNTQSDFQGGVCWPSVANKELERQPQSWLVLMLRPQGNGGWEQQRVHRAGPDLRVHFNTRQWLSGSCISPQTSTRKTHAGYTTNRQLLEWRHGKMALLVCVMVC